MKKIIFIFFVSFLFVNTVLAQMSDKQVIDYVKREHSKGTSEEQIAIYLTRRGVSKAQLERIKNQVESQQLPSVTSEMSSAAIHKERVRGNPDEEITSGDFDIISSEMSSGAFGRNIFNARNLTFNPNTNIPTPVDYRLGPGDEVIIDIWGASQNTVRQTISPEGRITVDRVGPIYLNGMTVKEANTYVQRKFAEVYAGLGTGISQIQLTLGQIRTIQINVMGEVAVPGTYSISSLSSVFHALYRAGGVNKIGSLRSVGLYRNNKLLRTLDVYEFLLNGKLNEDIRMTDGDMVIVPPYISLVDISGNVKRPMLYELKKNETIANLINYSGGFTGDAYTKKVRVTRNTNGENQIFTVLEGDFGSFKLKDKDVVTISSGFDLFENRVEILGAVYRPGYYEIGKGILTVKDLVFAADSIRGDAFLNRAVLTREKDDFTTEVLSVDLGSILFGSGQNIALRKNDILYIPSVHDLKEYGDFVIFGAIARPGRYQYSENTTLEDLLVQAGGLLESASTVRVDIARRIIDPKSTTVNNTLAETISLGIKDGFIVDGEKGFVLEPYDHVYVRRSPGYHVQKNVHLEGEVLFPGSYTLNKKTERVSDIIKRAGNLTPDAYAQGARLIRQRSSEEAFRSRMALQMAAQGGKDSIAVSTLDLRTSYSVGMDLKKALQYPGSDYDLVLREGDRLIIPEYENTVKIDGAVMYPNTVIYKTGEKLDYYINQAGGYSDKAKKSKAFVIHINGTVSKVKSSDNKVIQPGSEIIIPTKDDSNKLTWKDITSIVPGLVSLTTMVALLINTMSK
jgi:protein involved in polysaccharide export with SLBB domain